MEIIELIQANPKISVILLGIGINLIITLVTKLMTDQAKMKELKDKQNGFKIQMKNHKDNPEKLMEIQKEMLESSMEMMKHSFKPLLITLIPLLILFSWFRGIFAETIIANTWIWYYIGASLIASMFFRKVLKVA